MISEKNIDSLLLLPCKEKEGFSDGVFPSTEIKLAIKMQFGPTLWRSFRRNQLELTDCSWLRAVPFCTTRVRTIWNNVLVLVRVRLRIRFISFNCLKVLLCFLFDSGFLLLIRYHQRHLTTVFCKISFRKSKYCLVVQFSIEDGQKFLDVTAPCSIHEQFSKLICNKFRTIFWAPEFSHFTS